jgi:hypothetical protein
MEVCSSSIESKLDSIPAENIPANESQEITNAGGTTATQELPTVNAPPAKVASSAQAVPKVPSRPEITAPRTVTLAFSQMGSISPATTPSPRFRYLDPRKGINAFCGHPGSIPDGQ